jgi:hypothetical protein
MNNLYQQSVIGFITKYIGTKLFAAPKKQKPSRNSLGLFGKEIRD